MAEMKDRAVTSRSVPLGRDLGEDLRRVEQFLYTEADYMDTHDYARWLELWTEELEYWVPAHPDDESPHLRVAVVYDDRIRLEERLRRWTGGYAHAQTPRPALSRVVSNTRIVGEEEGRLVVTSRFVLTLLRPGRDTPKLANEMVFAGRTVHHLQPEAEGFRIARKTARLLNAHLPLPNIQFLL